MNELSVSNAKDRPVLLYALFVFSIIIALALILNLRDIRDDYSRDHDASIKGL